MYEVILVAEKSVAPGINCVVRSIREASFASKIIIICPKSQCELFESHTANFDVEVLSEEDILANWGISDIKKRLGRYSYRAGWYYQQFLKLAFCKITDERSYLIWDADTLCLNKPKFESNGRYIFTPSKELHKPYFETFKKLFGCSAVAKKSFISQYMVVNTVICSQMLNELALKSLSKDWVDAILTAIPLITESEFSEYETYGNFIAMRFPEQVIISESNKWFRYGSNIIELNNKNYNSIKKRFHSYKFVAFERHKQNAAKNLRARLLLAFKISS
ncbi:DUF6492 family protein [Porticoccaceae bacterium]|nr:DUF6492 family protein [Porticoccaceae bacterium]